ncbi:uncharacterized protein PAC_06714 [Phialocephala subalpina]|uniref:FAD-binding domain-containing protein n=1 Tax=Phialocephala subalpina TaxID=576137 RepID=A0A1L7WVN8_9HELO|nr:uncharacterized protein PAC_06714 [Phialocephala subalpina]
MASKLIPKFDIIVVGSGITGLSTAIACTAKGFNVTVLESSPKFSNIGAGLMISANATRILIGMGLRNRLEACGIDMKRVVFKKFDDGIVLDERMYEGTEEKLGAPNWQVHRADLHDALLEKATESGVVIQMGAKVQKYDWDAPSALLEDGSVVQGDVILAADGYRSRSRGELLGEYTEPRFSGNSAYRALIHRSEFENDPELSQLMEISNQTTFVWVGDGCHILGYPIRQGEYYNLVSTQSAIHTTGPKFVVPVPPSEFHGRFAHWDPLLEKILRHLPQENVLEWKLCDLAPMDSWIFPGGKIVLIGDASHAMLPSAAQGAGMGIEDGAAIAEILARVESKEQIPAALKAFQDLRLPRCTEVVDIGRQNAKKWHQKDARGGTVTDDTWNYDVQAEARRVPL